MAGSRRARFTAAASPSDRTQCTSTLSTVKTSVTTLVREHMNHQGVGKGRIPSIGAVRRLQRRLDAGGTSLEEWSVVVASDSAGRGPGARPDPSRAWSGVAAEHQVGVRPVRRLLTGKHLIDAGMKPGPDFKTLLVSAELAQDEGEFTDEAGAVAWLAGR